jgi:hypothetical protein
LLNNSSTILIITKENYLNDDSIGKIFIFLNVNLYPTISVKDCCSLGEEIRPPQEEGGNAASPPHGTVRKEFL